MPTKQRLRVTEIDTVGFVDKGDDPEADIIFWKARGDEDVDTPDPNLFKRLVDAIGGVLGADADEVEKDIAPSDDGGREDDGMDELQKKLEGAEAEIAVLTAKIAELEAASPEPEPEPEPDLPDEVQKRLEDYEKRAKEAEERVAKIEHERRREEFVAKARDLPLPGLSEDDADILMKCADALTDEEFAKLESILKGAAEAIKKGKLFSEIGSDGSLYGGLDTEVKAAVAEVRKSDPTLTEEQARAKVWIDNRDLYDRYEADRRLREAEAR